VIAAVELSGGHETCYIVTFLLRRGQGQKLSWLYQCLFCTWFVCFWDGVNTAGVKIFFFWTSSRL